MSDTKPLIYSELSEREKPNTCSVPSFPWNTSSKEHFRSRFQDSPWPFCRRKESWPHRKDEWSFLKVLSSLIGTFSIMACRYNGIQVTKITGHYGPKIRSVVLILVLLP